MWDLPKISYRCGPANQGEENLLDGIVHPSEHKDEELLGVGGNVQRSQVVPQSFNLFVVFDFTILKGIQWNQNIQKMRSGKIWIT